MDKGQKGFFLCSAAQSVPAEPSSPGRIGLVDARRIGQT